MKGIGRRLGEIIKRFPPQPLTELRTRVAEIIAQHPPQGLTWELSGDLGKIIGVRIARLPPEQRTEVAQLTIIEVLMTGTDVELIGLVRRHVAQELAQKWIPQKDFNKIYKRRDAQLMDSVLELANRSRETTVWDDAPQAGAHQAVRDLLKFGKGQGWWSGRGIHSVAGLVQYLKRWGPKKPQP